MYHWSQLLEVKKCIAGGLQCGGINIFSSSSSELGTQVAACRWCWRWGRQTASDSCRDTDTDAYHNTDADSNSCRDTDANSDTYRNTDAKSDAYRDTDADSDACRDTDADANSDTYHNTDAKSDACRNTDAKSDAYRDTDSDRNGDSKRHPDANTYTMSARSSLRIASRLLDATPISSTVGYSAELSAPPAAVVCTVTAADLEGVIGR